MHEWKARNHQRSYRPGRSALVVLGSEKQPGVTLEESCAPHTIPLVTGAAPRVEPRVSLAIPLVTGAAPREEPGVSPPIPLSPEITRLPDAGLPIPRCHREMEEVVMTTRPEASARGIRRRLVRQSCGKTTVSDTGGCFEDGHSARGAHARQGGCRSQGHDPEIPGPAAPHRSRSKSLRSCGAGHNRGPATSGSASRQTTVNHGRTQCNPASRGREPFS